MTVRLYLDEDSMDKNWVEALRARGVDVLTALEADMIERSDEEHLGYATKEGQRFADGADYRGSSAKIAEYRGPTR